MNSPLLFLLLAPAALVSPLAAAPTEPPGYYDSVDTTSQSALRQTLHEVIDDHLRYPYTATGTDTWDILEEAMEDPGSPSAILDVYKNASYPKAGGGNGNYDREHPWPKSYGFPDYNGSNYPYTDCHVLLLCNSSYNSSRSNKPYRYCPSGCDEKVTLLNNGEGGGSGSYPGNSNWTSGSGVTGAWETWIGRRGDVARALFYMDVRYEGGTHGSTGASEPDLILTDVEALIDASNTGSNESVAYMGMLAVLLEWHEQDPVDDFERGRHEVVFGYQGNRNPFVDHPEWVACLFQGSCGPAGVGTPFCFGDGSGTACPCGNTGGATEGCRNDSGQGATLFGSGSDEVYGEILVLHGAGLVPNQTGLYFQGNNAVNGGAGSVFGDGLRCAGGSMVRLQVRTSDSSGTSQTTIDIDAAGGAIPGQTKRYQLWYRDPNGSPCGSEFNLTNGLDIHWQI